MKKKVLVLGGGPHSKVCIDIMLHSDDYEVAGVIDKDGQAPFGIPVIGTDDSADTLRELGFSYAFVAIGSNTIRRKVSERALSVGMELVSVIADDAIISKFASIGDGVLINHGAIVNAEASIGDGTILNTGCTVDHDCVIGKYCHIAPGTHISGSSKVGDQTFLGTGTSVIDGITIGKRVMVGAGAAVVQNLPDNCTAVGVPAKVIRINEE